jgi:hypothetical protein
MKKFGFGSILLAISLFGIQQVFADNLPKIPAVTQCSVSPKDFPVSGGQVTVQVHIVSLNGVYSGVTAVTDNISKSGEHLFTGPLVRVNGSPQDGDWVGTFQIGNSNTPGNYRLSLFPISDVQGLNDGYIHCDSEVINLGVPKLGSTSNTASIFPIPAPTVTVTAQPAPAPTVTVTAQPTPAPTVTVTAQPNSMSSEDFRTLKAQVAKLQNQVKKICLSKPKPRGC